MLLSRHSFVHILLVTICFTALVGGVSDAGAQTASTPLSPPVAVVILPFTNGAVRPVEPWMSPRDRQRVSARAAEAEQNTAGMGVGIANLLLARLAASGAFHIMERQVQTAVHNEQVLAADPGDTATVTRARLAGARFIIAGAITQCDTRQRNLGGLGGRLGFFGLIGYSKKTTTVKLVARIINTTNGVVIAVVTASGNSGQGGGLTIGGIGRGGFGGGTSSTTASGSAFTEAAEHAVDELAEKLIAKQGTMLTS